MACAPILTESIADMMLLAKPEEIQRGWDWIRNNLVEHDILAPLAGRRRFGAQPHHIPTPPPTAAKIKTLQAENVPWPARSWFLLLSNNERGRAQITYLCM